MLRILQIIFVGVLVDFMYLGAILTVLPMVNMKQVMAAFGIILMGWNIIQTRQYRLSKDLLICGGISTAYSVINWISVEYNGTYDYTYANYLVSFLTWTFAGYTAMSAMRWVHGKATITLLTSYLAGLCAMQCIASLVMDNNEVIRSLVLKIFYLEVDFFEEIGRLYGIGGFALDTAGIRMACTAVMICHVLVLDENVQRSNWKTFYYVLCLIIIAGIGNIVSRTTTVGIGVGLLGMFLASRVWTLNIQSNMLRLTNILLIIIAIAIPTGVYLYNNDPYFYSQFRYAFEGFFNYVEQGEFRTTSTDLLLKSGAWPETLEEWIIGTGLYKSGDTDAGYDLLITYSGLVGFGTFASMFVYLTLTFSRQYPRYTLMFFLLSVVGFIVWRKVATDIFVSWAFLLFLDKDPNYNHNAKHIIV